MRADSTRAVLIALMIIGFALRAAGLLWGTTLLPFDGAYHPDEDATLVHVMGFPANFFAPGSFIHGSIVPHFVALLLLPFRALVVDEDWRLVVQLAMRTASVLAATASIGVAYLLGRRLWDRATGLIAAALLTVSFTHVANAAYATQDVLMSLFVVGAVALQLRAFETGRTAPFVQAGLVFGVLPGIKFSSGVLLALPALQLVAEAIAKRPIRPTIPRVAALYAAAASAFAVGSPRTLLHYDAFLARIDQGKRLWFDRTLADADPIPVVWWQESVRCFGVPVVVLALVGVALVARRPTIARIVVALGVAATYAFYRHFLAPRFLASIAPLVVVLAAAPLGMLLRAPKPPLRVAAGAALAIVLLLCTRDAVRVGWARWHDPRTEAARWLVEHAPRRATVAAATVYNVTSWELPALRRLPFIGTSLDRNPQFIVMSSVAEKTMTEALASPHLQPDGRWDPAHKADWYNYEPPRPAVFRSFAAIFQGETYRKVAWFPPPDDVRIEFADVGVSIYERK